MAMFQEAVNQWIADAKKGVFSQVTVSQMRYAHTVICRDKPMKRGAFMSMCAKRGFASRYKRVGEEAADRWRGWKIDWLVDDKLKRELKMHLKAVKTDAEIAAEIKDELPIKT